MQDASIPSALFAGEVLAVCEQLKKQEKITVKIGFANSVAGFFLARLIQAGRLPSEPILVLAADETDKMNLWAYFHFYQKGSLPRAEEAAQFLLLGDGLVISPMLTPALVLWAQTKNPCVFLACGSDLEELIPKKRLENYSLVLRPGDVWPPKKLLQKFYDFGYEPSARAREPLFASSRGSILDIYPPLAKAAVRIDFDGDTIESIKSLEKKPPPKLKEIVIPPASWRNLPRQVKLSVALFNPKTIALEHFPARAAVAVAADEETLKLIEKNLSQPARPKKINLSFLKNLRSGDYVIHSDHGLAQFAGLVTEKIDGRPQEYFKLIYAAGDLLLLPVTMAEKMEKYIGLEHPTLNRLSGSGWLAAVAKVKIDTLKEAREILNTQARRSLASSRIAPRDQRVEKMLAESFAFAETDDQKEVIETTYREMAGRKPMDRLICGDVGFGKTEVAIRASAKAALAGFQVAILCPTTILAQQHLDTFIERVKNLPVKVAGLSRFQSASEQKKTLKELLEGKIDIVIGTHRLLSGDVKFHNLNLIIIDEEQRFGVKHKEALKKLRSSAHALTLTATPIPRTLHLALSGVFNISAITTPPQGRLPIATHIQPYDLQKIREVLSREAERAGQAYFLYNNIRTIALKKKELESLLPKIKFAVLHGQLPEADIAKTMHEFDSGQIDVLVCSTIIENGLDLPNVNTLVVDNATQFGLSQLHQIRGRIGRGKRQAYAYFFYKRKKLINSAGQRLEALEEAQDLGAGYDLARRDMEIRGVGNVLGKRQHGHVRTVGLGLYLKLLGQAIEEIKKGERLDPLPDVTIDLPLEARLPEFFEPDKQKRLEYYHEWALLDSLEELEALRERLEKDGALPAAVTNLLAVFRLKIRARSAGLLSIDTTGPLAAAETMFICKSAQTIDPDRFGRLLAVAPGWQYGLEEIKIRVKDLGQNWLPALEKCLAALSK